jgi:chaperonin GroES
MNIRPTADRIVVQRQETETTTAAGIVMPDSATEKPSRGTVIATGKGKTSTDGTVQPMEINTGDQVYFGKYAGTEIEINNTTYVIMREEDVLAVLTTNETVTT